MTDYTIEEYDEACLWYDKQTKEIKKFVDILEAGDPWLKDNSEQELFDNVDDLDGDAG